MLVTEQPVSPWCQSRAMLCCAMPGEIFPPHGALCAVSPFLASIIAQLELPSTHDQPLSPVQPSSSHRGQLGPRPQGPWWQQSRRAATASWRCVGAWPPGSGCPGAAVCSPPGPWPLISVVEAALPTAVNRSELSPQDARESKGPWWGQRDGQVWAAPSLVDKAWGRSPSATPKVGLGWVGGNMSPKLVSWGTSSSSIHLLIPSAIPSISKVGSWSSCRCQGNPEFP